MARQAEAEWKGDLKGGTGRVKTGSGGYDGNYSFATALKTAPAPTRRNCSVRRARRMLFDGPRQFAGVSGLPPRA